MNDWLPLTFSGIALVVSAMFSWTAQSDRRSAARIARERDLHSWCREIGQIYVILHAGDEQERKRARAQLSVLIDYGRLLFPNETSQRAIQEYPKGRRSSVLDPLVETFRRNGDMSLLESAKLSKDWREFTDQLSKRTTAFAVETSPEAEGTPQYRNP